MTGRKRLNPVLLILVLAFFLIGLCLSCTSPAETCNTLQEYYLPPPEGWLPIGNGTNENFQQTFGYGDFDGDGEGELVGTFSHSAVGIFIHNRDGNSWKREVLYPKFDPTLNHVKGMEGGWPVKGRVSGDFDADGREEFISMADVVSYPPIHGNGSDSVPFPGAIYVDWVEGKGFIANPLIWGAWGENVSSRSLAIMIPKPVPATFRGGLSNSALTDFLVATLHKNGDKAEGRLFVLEQPKATFNSTDYRYVSEGVMDTDPTFPNEPFYIKHIYVGNSGEDEEMVFSPSEWQGATAASLAADVSDFNSDGLMDMVVAVNYSDNDGEISAGSIRAYQRLPARDGRNYRFAEIFRQDVIGANFWSPTKADLNGLSGDGKEGWIMGLRMDSPIRGFGVSGIATLQRTGDSWKLLGTHRSDLSFAYTYRSIYSNPAVIDADKDGYDDAAVFILKGIVSAEGENFMIGDLVLFRNVSGEIRGYEELFALGSGTIKSLWENDSFNWDVHTDDFNDDGLQEIGVSLPRPEPFHGPNEGTYQVYYAMVKWSN